MPSKRVQEIVDDIMGAGTIFEQGGQETVRHGSASFFQSALPTLKFAHTGYQGRIQDFCLGFLFLFEGGFGYFNLKLSLK